MEIVKWGVVIAWIVFIPLFLLFLAVAIPRSGSTQKPIMATELASGQCYVVDRMWARGVVVCRASIQDPEERHKEWVIWEGVAEPYPLAGQRFWFVRDPASEMLHLVVFEDTSGHVDELA